LKKVAKQLICDQLLQLGLVESPRKATALIMAGKVLVNDRPAKPGMKVSADDMIRIKGSQSPYLAKGGLKLAGALSAFEINPTGQVCLDAGASAGGFTDCLLKHGAESVYAVDVGFGQLLGSLRQNPRVVNLERTNLSSPELLRLNPRPSLATCDLSYLSLREAVPIYRNILGGEGTLICLVKPLFEVDDAHARRTGQIAEDAYAPMLRSLADYLNGLPGVSVVDVCASPVTGHGGTIEFFFHIVFGRAEKSPTLDSAIAKSVEAALQNQQNPREHTDV
jgi:23S rRNA (cytidine1920-2'-O)/16S rRNA (cytidine1409-2'-O)-methyltransferase